MSAPLSGITVIDLTRILSGPHCTRILADLGARVIKCEPPRGDSTRNFAPHIQRPSTKGTASSYFAQVNAGKVSLELDLSEGSEAARRDREILERLLDGADVLVENFRPGVIARLGFGWERLHAKFPRLIMCSISGFGQYGPLSKLGAVDTIIQALSGMMSVTSTKPAGEPTRCGVSVSDILSGVYAANGIQAALLARERGLNGGQGSYVDIAMLDCSVAASQVQLGSWGATGKDPLPIGNKNPVVSPFDNFRCKDGTRLVIACMKQSEFEVLARLIGVEHILEDTRFRNNNSRVVHGDDLSNALERGLASRTAEEWLPVLRKAGLTCAPVNSPSAVFRDPQVNARNMALRSRDGKFVIAGNPIKFDWVDDITVRENPPPLDQGREKIIGDLGIRSKL